MYVHNILYYCFNISVPAGQEYISPRTQSVLSTTVNVTWSPPRFPNGLLTRYEVYRYDPTDLTRPNLATSTLGTMLNALVTGLAPYTNYQISIRACNSKGCTGHSSRASFQTLPDGKIFYHATVSLYVSLKSPVLLVKHSISKVIIPTTLTVSLCSHHFLIH